MHNITLPINAEESLLVVPMKRSDDSDHGANSVGDQRIHRWIKFVALEDGRL